MLTDQEMILFKAAAAQGGKLTLFQGIQAAIEAKILTPEEGRQLIGIKSPKVEPKKV